MAASLPPLAIPEEDTQRRSLSLRANQLLVLPVYVKLSEHLQHLDFSENEFRSIPDPVFQLTDLVTLKLNKNRLEKIPDKIDALTNLKELDISDNYISSLPASMSSMGNLQVIQANANQFAVFPEEPVCNLPQLRKLYLGANQLSSLPWNIDKLQQLRVLYLGGNLLTALPYSIGHLASLKLLYLGDNNLESLPNSLHMMKSLTVLNIHNNQLTMLPPEILAMSTLQQMTLRNNPLVTSFVHEVAQQPLSLQEICGRALLNNGVPYDRKALPESLNLFLDSARRCTNPVCAGVYFSTRYRSVEFVDFCGKSRLPLIQFLCSAHAKEPAVEYNHGESCGKRMRKVLLTGYEEKEDRHMDDRFC